LSITGYRVTKAKDPETGQRSFIFQIDYPEIEEGIQPQFRFMSAFEQRREPHDPNFQYVLFAAEPYLTIAFKIPNKEIERDVSSGKLFYNWDKEKKSFTLQIYFKEIPPKEARLPADQRPPLPPEDSKNGENDMNENNNLNTNAADVD
jgi:splicing factor 3A subunit 2